MKVLCLMKMACIIAAILLCGSPVFTPSGFSLNAQEKVDAKKAVAEKFDPIPYLDKAIIGTDQKVPRIVLMDANKDWSDPSAILWQWKPYEAEDLLPQQRKTFSSVSDCKTINGGQALLIVASGGGIGIVDIPTKKVLFYAYASGNVHSAEQLPDGNVVSVSSTGNHISLFVRPDKFDVNNPPKPAKEYPFSDAHGCVWDKKQSLLWVWGENKIESYRYNGKKDAPELTAVKAYHPKRGVIPALPKGLPPDVGKRHYQFSEDNPWFYLGGHDAYPIPGKQALHLTCRNGVMEFDTETHNFKLLNSMFRVKSFTENPATKEQLYQKPTQSYWSDTVYTISGKKFCLPNAKFYKVRWYSKCSFSE